MSESDLWETEILFTYWFLLLSWTTVLCVESDAELSNGIFVISTENILKFNNVIICVRCCSIYY